MLRLLIRNKCVVYNIFLLVALSLNLYYYLFSSQSLSQLGRAGLSDRYGNNLKEIRAGAINSDSSTSPLSSRWSKDQSIRGVGLYSSASNKQVAKIWNSNINSTNGGERDAGKIEQNDIIRTTTKTGNRTFSITAQKFKAVEQERQIIERILKGYKFQTGKKINDFLMDEGGQPILNVIVSAFRSGSTFLGDTLNSHPATFYHAEPLSHLGLRKVRSGFANEEVLRVLNQLLSCNYTDLDDYMKSASQLIKSNIRIWQHCVKSREICADPNFLGDMCRLFPFQLVKLVRMPLRVATALLENKNLNIRILLLVRDPRGTMNSRNHVRWCREDPDCYDSSTLCMDMVDNYDVAENFRKQFPDRFLAIRYEDLSLNPFRSMKEIFKFLRMEYHSKVDRFLISHTKKNIGYAPHYGLDGAPLWYAHSTFRDSKTIPFRWRNDFVGNFTQVIDIQRTCDKAMKLWGYVPVSEPKDLETFNPLQKPPWPEMLDFKRTD